MNNNSITIQQRTKLFASRVIKAYSEINERNHFNSACAILSKQFLRSGTSIGANISEGIYAQSEKDFLSKYLIALNYIPLNINIKKLLKRSIGLN